MDLPYCFVCLVYTSKAAANKQIHAIHEIPIATSLQKSSSFLNPMTKRIMLPNTKTKET